MYNRVISAGSNHLFVMLVALLAASGAHAATFTVTTLSGAGAGSITAAVASANANPGADSIVFAAGITGTITITSELEVTDSVTITGPGSSLLTISGNHQTRIFLLNQFNSSHTHKITGLTLTDGAPLDAGGAIFSSGDNLTLDDMKVINNVAGGDGGGMSFDGGSLTITNSTFNNNLAENGEINNCFGLGDGTGGGRGGGIYVAKATSVLLQNVTVTNNGARTDGGGVAFYLVEATANILVRDCVISGNTAAVSPACFTASGGGLFALAGNVFTGVDDDTINVIDTTISNNVGGGGNGGGVFLDHLANATLTRVTINGNNASGADGGGLILGTGPITLENVTISANTAFARGGALARTPAGAGALTIRNSTISGNIGGTSGGVHALNGAVITIRNSIVANSVNNANAAVPDLANDASSSFNVAYSNIESTGTANVTDGGGNAIGLDPQLGPLANNGGTTQTQLPAITSPAYNSGDPAFSGPPASDQRRLLRVSGGRVDMGAVEVGAGARVRSDLNADGKSDIVLQNLNTASIAAWLMDNTTIVEGKVVANPVATWQIAATGDLDGDGKSDIILRNTSTNAIAWWKMNGTALVGGYIIATPASNWRVVTARDFNHDDRDDLILQNASTGAVALWTMNGATIVSGTVIGTPGVNVRAVGTGLFGGSDAVVVQDTTTGTISRWIITGNAVTSSLPITTPASTDWEVKAIGDFDGDGDSDLALQNLTTRTVSVTLMAADGVSVSGSGTVATPVPDWRVVGCADYNADGRGDLLLHNSSTSGIAQWQMNGTVIGGGWNIGTLAGWKPLGN